MIKIEKLSDLNKLSQINSMQRGYILNLVAFFCKQYETESIEEFGCFVIAESKEDIDNFKEIGLSQPLDKAVFEYVDLVTMESQDNNITFVNCLALLNNDYGVNIFVDFDLLTDEIKTNMLDEYTVKRINIMTKRQGYCEIY